MRSQYDLYNLANAAVEMDRFDEAIQYALEAIAIDPNYALAYGSIAHALNRLGQHDEAIEKAEKAIGIDPTEEWFYRLLADAWRCKKKYQKALQCVIQAISMDPVNAEAHHLHGSILSAQGFSHAAIEALERSLELDPQCANSYVALSCSHIVRNHFWQAEKLCRQALSIEPNNAAALHNLGICLENNGTPEKAAKAYQAAIVAEPNWNDTKESFVSAVQRMPIDDISIVFGVIMALLVLTQFDFDNPNWPEFICYTVVAAALTMIVGNLRKNRKLQRKLRGLEETDPELFRMHEQVRNHR